jgi:hypothetical protein
VEDGGMLLVEDGGVLVVEWLERHGWEGGMEGEGVGGMDI